VDGGARLEILIIGCKSGLSVFSGIFMYSKFKKLLRTKGWVISELANVKFIIQALQLSSWLNAE